LIPRTEKNLSLEDKRWIIALASFEAQELFFKSLLMRSISLEEMKEDLAKFKKAIGWKERPVYAC